MLSLLLLAALVGAGVVYYSPALKAKAIALIAKLLGSDPTPPPAA